MTTSKMAPTKAWLVGFAIMLFAVVIGELSIVFHDYVFYEMGVGRNGFLVVLWFLFALAAFITAYYAKHCKLILSISFVLVLPITAATIHYLNSWLSGPVDFAGMPGAIAVGKLYLFVGGVLVTAGAGLGVFLSQENTTGSAET